MKDTIKFWAAIGLAGFVWSLTPISWAIVLTQLYSQFTHQDSVWDKSHRNVFRSIVWYYALCEVPFSIYLAKLSRQVQRKLPPPDVDNETLDALLKMCLDISVPGKGENGAGLEDVSPTDRIAAFSSKFRRWFHGAAMEDIKADNVREWLAWALGGRELQECQDDPDRAKFIERSLLFVQDKVGYEFQEGYNRKCKVMRLTLDPCLTLHRPLGYYVVCNGVSEGTILWLRYKHGFKLETEAGCDFLVRQREAGSVATRSSPPILFLHGLGIGLGQYILFLKRLVHYKGAIVILVQPHISTSITHPRFLDAPSRNEHVEAVQKIVRRHHLEDTTIISHSNGTMVHGWLARGAPEIGRRHVLVDPVCFRLWEGATCFAFVGKEWVAGIEVLLGYFVAREVGVAYTISRRFIWTDMLFWIHDLGHKFDPSHLSVILGENDVLVDVPATYQYLRSSNVPDDCITICPRAQHGQALFLASEGMGIVCRELGLPGAP